MDEVVPEPIFEARSLRSARGWYVRVSWGYGQVEHVGGFASGADAEKWIKEKSAIWLRDRVGPKSRFQVRGRSREEL
jgi:hypothetical protein